mgnify:CR=1 FL=1
MRKTYQHKKNRLQKRIARNHARKQERMRIRFKQNRKRRNKLLQGKNKEQRNLYRLQERFKDFKKVKAPINFSLTENTDESLIFISKIESCLSAKKKVFVNLSNVEDIAHGAIVVLLSIMMKFKSLHIDFNGNFPKNKKANKKLVDSGFFQELYKNNVHFDTTYSLCRNKILTHANKVVDTKLSDSIVSEISTLIWGNKKRCTGVQRVFIELMQNTNNHASLLNNGEHHWWTTVEYSVQEKKAYFSFIDYGVGIIESLNNDTRGKFYNWIPKIKKAFSLSNNSEMLMLLMKGEMHKTSTGKYYRGKGLPCLFKACEDNKISNVVVISNDAKVDYKTQSSVKLKHSFKGTFVYWELNASNVNLNY